MVKKKIISMLVTAAMVIGMFPMIVSADTELGTFTDLQADLSSGYLQLKKDYVRTDEDSTIEINAGFVIVDFNGHTIDANGKGPVFVIKSGGTLQFLDNARLGGTVTGGNSDLGGAIKVEAGGAFRYYAGVLSGNTATEKGGAIYNEGVVTIQQGSGITTSISSNNAPDGAGIYNEGTVNLEGGSITENTATGNGGGIYQAGGMLSVKGTVTVSENTSNNVYLADRQKITCAGSFSNSKILVAAETSPATITSDFSGTTTAPFEADRGYELAVIEDGNNAGQLSLTKSGDEPVVVEPAFVGRSLTLDDGRIGLNVFVKLGTYTLNELNDASVTFVIPGRNGKTTEPQTISASNKITYKNQTYYKFTCYLSSLQMATQVTATFNYGEDKSISKVFSIEDYITSYLTNADDEEVIKGPKPMEKNLVECLAAYGHYLQPYLSATNSWSLDTEDGYARMSNVSGYTYSDSYIDDVMNACSNYQAQKTVGASISGVSFKLELASTNAVIVTFTLASNVTDKLNVTCDHAGETAYKQGTNKYVIRISDIPIQDMADEINITGTIGEEEVSVTIRPLGYVYYAIRKDDSSEQMKKAMVSLYDYWNYAKKYADWSA